MGAEAGHAILLDTSLETSSLEADGCTAQSRELPTSSFLFVTRFLAIDHENDLLYFLCLHAPDKELEARGWIQATKEKLRELERRISFGDHAPSSPSPREGMNFQLLRDYSRYTRMLHRSTATNICRGHQRLS